MTYAQLLMDPEWRLKRKEILKRDNLECKYCSNKRLFENTYFGPSSLSNLGDREKIVYHFEGKVDRPQGKLFSIEKDVWLSLKSRTMLATYIEKKNDMERSLYTKLIALRVIEDSDFELMFGAESIKHLPLERQNAQPPKKYQWQYVAGLHVHHTYYLQSKLPWEYPEDSLETVCWHCHEDIHKNKTIPYYSVTGETLAELNPCIRCHGAGEFPEYKHIERGICFRCSGAKYEEFIGNNHNISFENIYN